MDGDFSDDDSVANSNGDQNNLNWLGQDEEADDALTIPAFSPIGDTVTKG